MPSRRTAKGGLVRALEQSTQPIYALDEQRKIVFANNALAAWLEIAHDELIGQSCNYHSRADADLVERILASLCPPPDAFSGRLCQGRVGGGLLDVAGARSLDTKMACFWPIAIAEGSYLVLAIIDPSKGQLTAEQSADSGSASTDLHRQLVDWRRRHASIYRLDRVLGTSPSIRAAQRVAQAAIASGADTLIVGPKGSGGEQVARAIHYSQYTPGQAPPLIPFDCAIGDAEGLQFALRQVQSDRERSAKGRVLLLHADRMAPALIHELSGFVGLPAFDIGLLSTSEISLRDLVANNEFDAALAQHLAVLELELPPLAQRIHDLPLICQAMIEDFNAEGNRQFSGLSGDALELLSQYSWPGNIDELAQAIHEACRAAEGPLLRASNLPKRIHQGVTAVRLPRPTDVAIKLPEFLKEIEDELMARAIRAAKGNKAKAARMLGISRQRLIRWSAQHSGDSDK
jgi:transcriptional regulator with PAS, ATPase and Fis domain